MPPCAPWLSETEERVRAESDQRQFFHGWEHNCEFATNTLMAMKHLASDPGRRAASAREIAETYDIPVDLMAKVLTRLVRSGLLTSHQGIHGGYELAQPPAATSVAVVIEA